MPNTRLDVAELPGAYSVSVSAPDICEAIAAIEEQQAQPNRASLGGGRPIITRQNFGADRVTVIVQCGDYAAALVKIADVLREAKAAKAA